MAWAKLLLSAAVLGSTLITPLAWHAGAGSCTQLEINAGLCSSASIDGGGVNLGATQEVPGSAVRGGGGDASDDASGGAGADSSPTQHNGSFPDAGKVAIGQLRNTVTCQAPSPCGTPAVRLSDLINFRAPAPTTSMEPTGWAVIGLDANFIAAAGVDVQSGTLLGQPAQVRFTPSGFLWDYGDGTTRRTAAGGASWAAMGLSEFSATPTSHAYLRAGTFTVRIAAGYTAEYRFGGQGWQQIDGSLSVPATDFTVVVGDAKTVLVGRDCAANPHGPGC